MTKPICKPFDPSFEPFEFKEDDLEEGAQYAICWGWGWCGAESPDYFLSRRFTQNGNPVRFEELIDVVRFLMNPASIKALHGAAKIEAKNEGIPIEWLALYVCKCEKTGDVSDSVTQLNDAVDVIRAAYGEDASTFWKRFWTSGDTPPPMDWHFISADERYAAGLLADWDRRLKEVN